MKLISAFLATATLLPSALMGGTYLVGDRVAKDPADPGFIGPFAILHPLGWTGAPGVLELRVCAIGDLKSATRRAVFIWNNLTPSLQNCGGTGCVLANEVGPDTGDYDAMSAVLHEIGHCAFGLGHSTMDSEVNPSYDPMVGPTAFSTASCDLDGDGCCNETVDFTPSANAVTVVNLLSTPPGSRDDDHVAACSFIPGATVASGSPPICFTGEPCTGAPGECCPICPGPACPVSPIQVQNFSWFRKVDNNPFAIDSLVIDRNSFGRVRDNLPVGHKYAANANRAVGEALSPAVLNSQSIMYPFQARGQVHLGLSPDDVNMVRMAQTGIDRLAPTADDYRTYLRWVEDCATAHIRVDLTLQDDFGLCEARRTPSFVQGAAVVHWSIALLAGDTVLPISLKFTADWDFGPEALFLSGFESGDISEWTLAAP